MENNNMKKYEVSFLENNVYQEDLVQTSKEIIDIVNWYKTNRPDVELIGITTTSYTNTNTLNKPVVQI